MRISRERMYMDVAQAFARRSTCFRNNVGAVIVNTEGWVIDGTGYNGPPPGDQHCTGNSCARTNEGGCQRSIHAEINALLRMKNRQEPSWLFSTRSPCSRCAGAIIIRGSITRVFYEEEYRDTGPLQALYTKGIDVFRITPSGYLIRWPNNVIVSE